MAFTNPPDFGDALDRRNKVEVENGTRRRGPHLTQITADSTRTNFSAPTGRLHRNIVTAPGVITYPLIPPTVPTAIKDTHEDLLYPAMLYTLPSYALSILTYQPQNLLSLFHSDSPWRIMTIL